MALGPVDIADIIAAFTAIILVFTGYINFRSLRYQAQVREIDVVMRCQDKYNRLIFEVKPLALIAVEDFSIWNDYYWSLQADQFLYWKRGWIGDGIMLHWLEHRFNSFRKNDSDAVGGKVLTYSDRWDMARRGVKDKSFIQMIEYIRRIASPDANYDYKDAEKMMGKLRRRGIVGLLEG